MGRSRIGAIGMSLLTLRDALPRNATVRQLEVLAAYVSTGGSVANAANVLGIQAGTVKRHLADLRARFGRSTEQLIYDGRACGWLKVPSLEPQTSAEEVGRVCHNASCC